jgi:hypothetical protein
MSLSGTCNVNGCGIAWSSIYVSSTILELRRAVKSDESAL